MYSQRVGFYKTLKISPRITNLIAVEQYNNINSRTRNMSAV